MKQKYQSTLLLGIIDVQDNNFDRYYPLKQDIYVIFEVLTAVVTKNSVFWEIMLCSPLKANGRFGETCCLSL
jgi:hypothetical protein